MNRQFLTKHFHVGMFYKIQRIGILMFVGVVENGVRHIIKRGGSMGKGYKNFQKEPIKNNFQRVIEKMRDVFIRIEKSFDTIVSCEKGDDSLLIKMPTYGVILKKIPIILFAIIILFAFCIRKHTFNLPHVRGDQNHYIGLAYKLETKGIEGYNLRELGFHRDKTHPELLQMELQKGKGGLLKELENLNITYYDEPLHHIPFGFSIALMLSHKIFADGEPYYLLERPNNASMIDNMEKGIGLRNFKFNSQISNKQFYAVIVPLVFSILFIILVYVLAKVLYDSEWIALTAMFLMAISPTDILTSQKVWADDMTAMLTVLAVLLYFLSVKKNKWILAFVGGLMCGLSVITKQNGGFILIVVLSWHFISNLDKLFKKETFIKAIFDRNILFFTLGAVISSGYWFISVFMTYEELFYQPIQYGIAKEAKTVWFKYVSSFPKEYYFVGIPYQNPYFIFSYVAPLMFFFDKIKRNASLLLILWMFVFMYIFHAYLSGSMEHRYLLPAYPAFAILSGYVANKVRILINNRLRFSMGNIVFIVGLIASAFWCIPMAMNVLFGNGAMINNPF